MERSRSKTVASLVLGLALVAACDGTPPVTPVPFPRERPEPPRVVAPMPVPAVDPELAAYYQKLQQDLLVQGLLRTDGGGPDVPFNARDLTRNFIAIAMFDEYTASGGALVARASASALRRWDRPVTLSMVFGESVPPAQRTRDRNAVIQYAARLSRVTGHPIRTVASGGNFSVLVLSEAERRAFAPRLQAMVPGIGTGAVSAFTTMPRDTLCLVFAFSDALGSSRYGRAVAVIRAEHPDLLRLSCLHEEIAQGLGLANDSPMARPSIFNDDEEFGLLTTHDEQLLRILYDPRLRPGMTEPEARPIVRMIADQLMGGES